MSAWSEAVYLLNKITEKFTALTTLVNEVKTEATSAKTNASNAATDAASIKTTVGTINTNVNTVKTDVATIKTDAAAAKTSAASAATDAATAKTNASNANTNAGTAATRAQTIIDTLGSRGSGSTVYSLLGTIDTNASNAATRAQSILTAINNGGMNTSAIKSIQKGTVSESTGAGQADRASCTQSRTITISSVDPSKCVLLVNYDFGAYKSTITSWQNTYTFPVVESATAIREYSHIYYLDTTQTYYPLWHAYTWTLIEFY